MSHSVDGVESRSRRRRNSWERKTGVLLLCIVINACLLILQPVFGVGVDVDADVIMSAPIVPPPPSAPPVPSAPSAAASLMIPIGPNDSPPMWASQIQHRLRSLDFPFRYKGQQYARKPLPTDLPPVGTLAYFEMVEQATMFRLQPTPQDLSYRHSNPEFHFTKAWGHWPSVTLRRRRWHMEGAIGIGTPTQYVNLVIDTGEAKSWVFDASLRQAPEILKFKSTASKTFKMDGRLDDYIRTPHFVTIFEGQLASDTMEIGRILHPRIDFILVNKDQYNGLADMFEHSGVLGLGVLKRPGLERSVMAASDKSAVGLTANRIPLHHHYWERLTIAQSNVHFFIYNLYQPTTPLDCGCPEVAPQTGHETTGSICDFTFLAPDVPVAPMPNVMDMNTGWSSILDIGRCPSFASSVGLLKAAAMIASAAGPGLQRKPKIPPCWCKREQRRLAQKWIKFLITMPKHHFETIKIPTLHRRRRLLALATEVEQFEQQQRMNGTTNLRSSSSSPLLSVFSEESSWVESRILQRRALREKLALAEKEFHEQFGKVAGADEGRRQQQQQQHQDAIEVDDIFLSESESIDPSSLQMQKSLQRLLSDETMLHELDLDPTKISQMSDPELDTIIDYAEARRNEIARGIAEKGVKKAKEMYQRSVTHEDTPASKTTTTSPSTSPSDHHVVNHKLVPSHEHELEALVESHSTSQLESSSPPNQRRSRPTSKSNPEKFAVPISKKVPQPPPHEPSKVPLDQQNSIGEVVPKPGSTPPLDPRTIIVNPTETDLLVGKVGYIPTLMEMEPIASFYFQGAGGCYHAGFMDKRYYKGPITWLPATHATASWTIPITDILIDGQTTGICATGGGCLGALSTGSGQIRGSLTRMGPLMESLPIDPGCIPNSQRILTFVLSNGMKVDLDGNDLTQRSDDSQPRRTPKNEEHYKFQPDPFEDSRRGGDWCSSVLGVYTKQDYIDERLFILGTPFLQKFYTVFDYVQNRIGFGQPRHEWYTINGCAWEGGVLQSPTNAPEVELDRYEWCRPPVTCGGGAGGSWNGGGTPGFSGSGAVGKGKDASAGSQPNPFFTQQPGQPSSLAVAARTAPLGPSPNLESNLNRALVGPGVFKFRKRPKPRVPGVEELEVNKRRARHERERKRRERVRHAKAKAKAKKRRAKRKAKEEAKRRKRRRKYRKPTREMPPTTTTTTTPIPVTDSPVSQPSSPKPSPPQPIVAPLSTDWTTPIVHTQTTPRRRTHRPPASMKTNHVTQPSNRVATSSRRRAASPPPPKACRRTSSQPRPSSKTSQMARVFPGGQTRPIARRHVAPSIAQPKRYDRYEKVEEEVRHTPKESPKGKDMDIGITHYDNGPDEDTHLKIPNTTKKMKTKTTPSPSPPVTPQQVSNDPNNHLTPASIKTLRAAGMDPHPTRLVDGLPAAPSHHAPDYPFDINSYDVDDVVGNVGTSEATTRAVDSTVRDALKAISDLGLKDLGLPKPMPRAAPAVGGGRPFGPARAVRAHGIDDDPYDLHQQDILLAKSTRVNNQPTTTTTTATVSAKVAPSSAVSPSLSHNSMSTPTERLGQVKELLAAMQHAQHAREGASSSPSSNEHHPSPPQPHSVEAMRVLQPHQSSSSSSSSSSVNPVAGITSVSSHVPPDDVAREFMPSWKKFLFRD